MFSQLWPRLTYFLGDFSFYLILITLSVFLSLVLFLKIYRSTLPQEKKKIYLSIVFVFFVLIITFSSFEAYFRYIYDQPDALGFLKVNERWHKRHVIYNSYFFRDRDFDQNKKEGVTRIGVLGDSIAFGGGIENVDDRFSNILEKKLRDGGHNVEVYNLGAPGYDTEGEIENYQKVKQLNFDIIVWEYFLNDIQRLNKSTGTPIIVKSSQQGEIVKFFSSKSFFFDWLFWRFSSRYNKTLGELRQADLARYQDLKQLKDHKEEIALFLKSLEQDNKKTVVIIFPFLYFLGPNYPAIDIHNMMSNHFRDNGAVVIDMLDELRNKNGRELWASEFDSHPNEFVHNLAAQKLFEVIAPLLK